MSSSVTGPEPDEPLSVNVAPLPSLSVPAPPLVALLFRPASTRMLSTLNVSFPLTLSVEPMVELVVVKA